MFSFNSFNGSSSFSIIKTTEIKIHSVFRALTDLDLVFWHSPGWRLIPGMPPYGVWAPPPPLFLCRINWVFLYHVGRLWLLSSRSTSYLSSFCSSCAAHFFSPDTLHSTCCITTCQNRGQTNRLRALSHICECCLWMVQRVGWFSLLFEGSTHCHQGNTFRVNFSSGSESLKPPVLHPAPIPSAISLSASQMM